MKKHLGLVAVLALAGAASAQSLELTYCAEANGSGGFDYTFTLKPDAGWAPGMGWRWFIFGDDGCFTCSPTVCVGPGPNTQTPPIADFSMDPSQFPVGPWTALSSSGGCHNGPTFSSVLDYWIPTSGSDSLTWTGTSANNVPAGLLVFSTLAGTVGGAVAADYKVATIDCATACYADCDGNGTLNIFDYICFGNAYAAQQSYADCDGNGAFNIFDYICFGNAYAAGCP